jgi:hypothetical protein
MRKLFWFVGVSLGYVVMRNLGVHVNILTESLWTTDPRQGMNVIEPKSLVNAHPAGQEAMPSLLARYRYRRSISR